MDLKAKIATLLLFLATNAGATTLGFDCITDNDPSGSSCYISQSQMGLDIESRGDEQMLFTLFREGARSSHFPDYFEKSDSGYRHGRRGGYSSFPGYFEKSDSGYRYGRRRGDSHFPGCFGGHHHDGPPAVVPLPAAAWLFGSGLLALFGMLKRSK